MVTGHFLAEPRLEGVLEHPDLALNGKVPRSMTPLLADDATGDCSTKVLASILLFTISCRRSFKAASWSLLNTTSQCFKPNSFRKTHIHFAGNSWLAPFSGTTLAKRYFVPNCFATRMHLGRVSAVEPKKQQSTCSSGIFGSLFCFWWSVSCLSPHEV